MTRKTCSECGELGHNKVRHAPPRRTSLSYHAADMVDREGCNLADAAIWFGITPQAVSLVLVARHGAHLTPGMKRRSMRRKEREAAEVAIRESRRESRASGRDAVLEGIRSGQSIAQASSETGHSYHAIWEWCVRAGLRSRPSLGAPPKPGEVTRTSLALQLVDSGLTLSEAARRVGISPQALRRGQRRRNGEVIP